MTVAEIAATTTTTTTGWLTSDDNCRTVENIDQTRTQTPRVRRRMSVRPLTTDGTIDAEDNCFSRANPDQADNERDGAGQRLRRR